MSKVRTFSRYFPKGHPKEGKPTFFVEKIYKCLYLMKEVPKEIVNDFNFAVMNDDNYKPKLHTVRAGKHFKSGDYFSPRIWTDKPYNSKQITIADDVLLKKVYDFKIEIDGDLVTILINGKIFYEENTRFCTQYSALEYLAQNDGLSVDDFKRWFNWGKNPFDGQILCWSDNVEY